MIINSFARTAKRALLLTVVIAALYFIPYESLDNLTVLATACILAIPIAAYRLDYRLFARRAVISQATTANGIGRKFLWNGTILKLSTYVFSVLISLLIVSIATSLSPFAWLIIIAAALLLVLSEAITFGFVQKHTQGDFADIFQRGLIKYPITAFIVAVTFYFYINETYPSFVGADLSVLAEKSFHNEIEKYTSSILGYTKAITSTLDTVTMYGAQNYIPRIDDIALKWSLWSYLAIKASVSTGLIVYLLLGILTLASIRERGGWSLLGSTVFEKSFTLTLIMLFAVYIYASRVQILPLAPPEPLEVDCSKAMKKAESIRQSVVTNVETQEAALKNQVESDIDAELDRIFSSASDGVDKYLDWHFSVLGEYQRLGSKLIPTIEKGSREKLQSLVFSNINNKVNEYQGDLSKRILSKINEVSAMTGGVPLSEDLSFSNCVPSLDYDPIVFTGEAGYVGHPQTVLASSAVAAIIAKKTAAKLGAKGVGKVAAKFLGPLFAGMGAAPFCGPMAPLCGIAVAGVTWVSVDAAIVSVDEIMSRDELRQDILREMDTQKQKMRNIMISLNQQVVTTNLEKIKKVFSIPDDGI